MKTRTYEFYKNFLKILCNKTRFEIIILLRKGPKSVNEISKKLGFEQSRVSHNLKKLEKSGLVKCDCNGKKRIYCLNGDYIVPILGKMEEIIHIKNKK
ncbi:winged helix-turn-helix transcriptional regulator [Candidatus Pacearchaeota archaeon]|nr:winged helix-turn-helix transcriptional regulator [Candidatus Pacearchaeota archaeon]